MGWVIYWRGTAPHPGVHVAEVFPERGNVFNQVTLANKEKRHGAEIVYRDTFFRLTSEEVRRNNGIMCCTLLFVKHPSVPTDAVTTEAGKFKSDGRTILVDCWLALVLLVFGLFVDGVCLPGRVNGDEVNTLNLVPQFWRGSAPCEYPLPSELEDEIVYRSFYLVVYCSHDVPCVNVAVINYGLRRFSLKAGFAEANHVAHNPVFFPAVRVKALRLRPEDIFLIYPLTLLQVVENPRGGLAPRPRKVGVEEGYLQLAYLANEGEYLPPDFTA